VLLVIHLQSANFTPWPLPRVKDDYVMKFTNGYTKTDQWASKLIELYLTHCKSSKKQQIIIKSLQPKQGLIERV